MLVPFALPLLIALILSIFFSVIFIFTAHCLRFYPKTITCLAIIAILPLTYLLTPTIFDITYDYRYGLQPATTADDLHSLQIPFPSTSHNHILYLWPGGHQLRCKCTHDIFLNWAVHSGYSPLPDVHVVDSLNFEFDFQDTDWQAPTDLIAYQTKIAANGAHSTAYFSPSSETLFISASYW